MIKIKPDVKLKSWILVAVFAVLIFLDLLFKYLEETYEWDCVIISGLVEIHHGIRNPGCAFSFLNDNPDIGQPLLISVTSVLLVVLVVAFILLKEKYMVTKTSVAIIAAGAVGNLVDRCMFREVRDFFGLNMFGMTYCNFADFFIVIGAILLVIDILFLEEWSVLPLTKKARAGAEEREAREKAEQAAKEAAKAANAGSETASETSREAASEMAKNAAENTESKDAGADLQGADSQGTDTYGADSQETDIPCTDSQETDIPCTDSQDATQRVEIIIKNDYGKDGAEGSKDGAAGGEGNEK